MSTYPDDVPSLTNPISTNTTVNPSHADQHTNANDEIEAICTELGTNPKGTKADVKTRLVDLDALSHARSHALDSASDHSGTLPDTSLDQITTASKVHGSSMTGLASIPSGAGVIPLANATNLVKTVTTTINAAVSAIGATPSILLISSAQTLTASLTIPSTLTLQMLPGGSIVKASTYTLTINGDLVAGHYQVFSGFATGDVTFGAGAVKEAYLEWWGAVGDGIADDHVPFENAIAATTVGIPIHIIGTYLVTNATISITSRLCMFGDSPETSILKGGSSSITTTKGLSLKNISFDAWTDEVITLAMSVDVDGITIENCKLTTSSVGFVKAVGTSYSVTNFTMRDCYIYGCTQWAVRLSTKFEDIKIVNNTFDSIVGDTSSGGILIGAGGSEAAINAGSRAVIEGNTFNGFDTEAGVEGHCILVYGNGIVISKNVIQDCYTDDIADHEPIYTKSHHCVISDNIITASGNATSEGIIAFKGGQYSYANECSNNIIQATIANTGIFANGSIIISDNHISILTGSCLNLYLKPTSGYAESQAIILDGNYLKGSETISVHDCKNSIITNNYIENSAVAIITLSKVYEATYPAQGLVISGNTLQGDSGAGTLNVVYSVHAVLDTHIFNNRFIDVNVSPAIGINVQESAQTSNNNFSTGDIGTLVDGATPSVVKGHRFWLTGGTTTITNIRYGFTGQVLTIIAEHTITITDGTNIFLNGSANFAMTATDTLTLVCKADGKWYEVGRSDSGA